MEIMCFFELGIFDYKHPNYDALDAFTGSEDDGREFVTSMMSSLDEGPATVKLYKGSEVIATTQVWGYEIGSEPAELWDPVYATVTVTFEIDNELVEVRDRIPINVSACLDIDGNFFAPYSIFVRGD